MQIRVGFDGPVGEALAVEVCLVETEVDALVERVDRLQLAVVLVRQPAAGDDEEEAGRRMGRRSEET